MAEMTSSQYWCHQCNQTVVPILGDDEVYCSRCNGGFVEELEAPAERQPEEQQQSPFGEMDPRILALLSGGGGFRAEWNGRSDERGTRIGAMEEAPAPVMMQMMNALATAMAEMHLREEAEGQEGSGSGGRSGVVVVDRMGVPLLMLQGTHSGVSGTLGDYFLGQGMEALLQRLAENDPNRYGTPPAAKEAVEGLPVVKITEEHLNHQLSSECAVCMEEFAVGEETRQLPCKHLYHGDCIFPWLKMHSSCPVCRFQLPAEEEGSGKPQAEESTSEGENGNDGNNGNGWFGISMPFNMIGNFVSSALRRRGSGNNEGGNNGSN